jgi:hypothetical protein
VSGIGRLQLRHPQRRRDAAAGEVVAADQLAVHAPQRAVPVGVDAGDGWAGIRPRCRGSDSDGKEQAGEGGGRDEGRRVLVVFMVALLGHVAVLTPPRCARGHLAHIGLHPSDQGLTPLRFSGNR